MARISTYPRDTFVTGLDKWIGTDANTENLATKNFTANAVADYFNRSAIIDTGSFSWAYAPYSNTQPQAEKSFQQIDRVAQNINITGLAAEPLRVSALTLANTMPRTFIINEWVGQSILVHVPSSPSQYAIYNVIAVTPDTEWFFLIDLEFVSGISSNVLEGESLVFGFWSGANVVTSVTGTFPIIATGDNDVVISLDTTTRNNWNTAYNRSLVSAAVTGTTTKTLTLTEQSGATLTTSWVDANTDAVTSVFGRTGAIVAQAGDYTTTLVAEGTNLYFTDQRARNVISSSITGIDYSNTTGIFSLASGFVIPTTTQATQWTTAYNDSIISAAVTGTTTKTLTLNQQDGGTVTASWTDDNTNIITSVFGRTGAVVAQSGDYTTTLVTEGDNLYFTTARAREAISLTTTGTSGPATYSSSTGILNIPQYQGGVTSFNTRTGAITLTSTDVTDALGFTPENVANKSNDTALGTSATLYPTQNAVKVYVDSATAGGIILQGDWNAATNTPNITATTQTGFAWRVSVAGNTDLGGITDWLVNDLAVKTATGWIKIDNTESVTSVFGRFGTVVAQSGDYNTDLVTEGTTNLYFTTARARTSISAGTGISYDSATGVISSSGGSVTSVGLSMPSAFTVTNSPVTGAGTLTVTGAGTTAQYIRGDGSLATLPSTSNEAKTLIREVYNKTGATLTKGTVVYINDGQGNLPAVTKAIATGDMTSAQTFGLVQSDITDQNNGFVVVVGGLDNLNTQGLGVGTQLYLSSTVPGAYTTVKQYAPAHLVYIAVVVRDHPTQGVIEVNIQNGYELDELHNVSARNPNNNDIIAYNTTTSLWEKKSIATTLGYTPANAATTLTINGTEFSLAANRTWNVGTVTSVGLALGTSGTDANISNSPITSTGEITLNLPTASATNRGLLSNGDWTTFNSKQTLLNGQGFVKVDGTLVSYDPTSYTPTSRTLTINGTTYDLSENRSWTVGASTSARTEQVFTATAGQQVFTVTGGYVVGLIDVYVNGVKLIPSTDFTAGNGTSVTLTEGVVLADIVSIITYTANITVPSVSGSGTTNTIAKFVGSTAIGDSAITDNGTTVTLVGRALSGTSATFSDIVSITANNSTAYSLNLLGRSVDNATTLNFFSNNGATRYGFIYTEPTNMQFGVNGAVRLTIASTGAATFSSSVTATSGIFTQSAGNSLQVYQTSATNATTAIIRQTGAGGNGGQDIGLLVDIQGANDLDNIANFRYYNGSTYTSRMVVKRGGNVGIGTTSPSRLFEVASGGDTGYIRVTGNRGNADGVHVGNIEFYNSNTTRLVGEVRGITGTGGTQSNSGQLAFYTNDNGTYAERMRITSAGNVGIGTTSPSVLLHLSGSGNEKLRLETTTSTANYIGFYTGATRTHYFGKGSGGSNDLYCGIDSSANIFFDTNASTRMTITGSGNVGIGTTAPTDYSGYTTLHLNGKSGAAGGLLRLTAFDNSSSVNIYAANGINFNTTSAVPFVWLTQDTERMRITSGGNVLIGATNDYSSRVTVEKGDSSQASPHFHLSNTVGYGGFHFLDGTAYYIGQNSNFRSLRMYSGGSTGTGVNLAAGATSWGTYSDERMKTDLVDIENATEKVSQLRSMIGRYKTDEQSKKRSFLIAQDLKEVLPEAISEDLQTGMLEIRYTEVIPLLVASIKELKAELDTANSRLQLLENK